MARQESDREDLWAEAVSLISRAELAVTDQPSPVIAGYRSEGWCTFYFGQDVMLQFTSAGGLRRAYRHGDLFRTQGDALCRLRRGRAANETTLWRHDLTPVELAEFRDWSHALLAALQTALSTGRVTVLREVNSGPEPLLERLAHSLEQILAAEPFLAPPISVR
jgi:hypothetical protein